MILGNSYLRSIINIGNQTTIKAQIDTFKESFRQLGSDDRIKRTLFNQKLNSKEMYPPLNSTNMNISLDHIDLFYIM